MSCFRTTFGGRANSQKEYDILVQYRSYLKNMPKLLNAWFLVLTVFLISASLLTHQAMAADQYSVAINQNAPFATSKFVQLSLQFPPQYNKLRISDRIFSESDRRPIWRSGANEISWILSGSNGTKSVFIQYWDEQNNLKSPVVSDSITLDTLKPKGSVSINNGQKTTQAVSVNLQLSSSDKLSGVHQMLIANEPNFIGRSWQSVVSNMSWQLEGNYQSIKEKHSVYVKFRDNAGNVSRSFSDAITLVASPGPASTPSTTPSPYPTISPTITVSQTPTPVPSPSSVPTATPTPTPTPTTTPNPIEISQINPQSGIFGAVIHILGSNFGTFIENVSKVLFKDIPATVLSWTDTLIETVVPDGATTGTVMVVNQQGQVESQQIFEVIPPNPSVKFVTGELTQSQSWTPEYIYVIENVSLPQGVTLTIQPGTIVKIINFGIDVNNGGVITAVGTYDRPIIFTGFADDSAGGDTNEDGNTRNPFYGTAIIGDAITLEFTEIREGRLVIDCNFDGITTLVDNQIKNQLSLLHCHKGNLVLQRNHFSVTDTYPIRAEAFNDLDNLILSGENKNTFTGENIEVALYIGSFARVVEHWNIDPLGGLRTVVTGGIEVIGEVNVMAGSVIKGGGFLVNGGTLNITGSDSEPVVMTVVTDDSAGGDLFSDGQKENIYTGTLISNSLTNGILGKVSITHADLRYSHWGIQLHCEDGLVQAITDNTLRVRTSLNNCNAQNLKLERNHFALTEPVQDFPLEAHSSHLDAIPLAGENANTFTGADRQVALFLNDTKVPTGTTWDVDLTNGLRTIVFDRLMIEGTLNLAAGTIIKGGEIKIVNGSLNIAGTETLPVIYTSWQDDSEGGNSNGSEPDNPIFGYQTAIEIGSPNSGGSLAASHLRVKNTGYALDLDCINDQTNISVSDSLFHGQVMINNCRPDALVFQNNHFDLDYASITGGHALYINRSDLTTIPLVGQNRNTFIGESFETAMMINDSQVPLGSTWNIDPGGGLQAVIPKNFAVEGTLVIHEGSIIKNFGGYGIWTNQGTLIVQGSATNPVIFTSYTDDLVGGDTNRDGTSTTPVKGDAGYHIRLENPLGTDSITGAVFRYATTAVSVGNLSGLSVHNCQFAYNDASFTVDTTTEGDPFMSALPCVPPWVRIIGAQDNWFGKAGFPGTSTDISSVGGAFIPELFGALYNQMFSMIDVSIASPAVGNTTPWALYSCELTSGLVWFYMTPVNWFRPLPAPPYPLLSEF